MKAKNIIYIVLMLLILEPWTLYMPQASITRRTTVSKTKMKRSSKRRKTKSTVKTTRTRIGPFDDGTANWIMFVTKFRIFYCMKVHECKNWRQNYEKFPKKECGRCYLTRELVWFDHKCSLWVANCRGMGMFFRKKLDLCESEATEQYIDEDLLYPSRILHLTHNS